MNTKKLAVILIAVAFSLIVLFSCVSLFSVKEVDVDFAVSGETDTSVVQEVLDEYLGKNLLFLKEEQVKEALKDYHYMEILSVEKLYPNVLKVKIEERRETYYLEHGDKVYVTTSEGFVLNIIDREDYQGNNERDKITLKITDVEITDQAVEEKDSKIIGNEIGETISILGDDFLSQVFEMAKSVQLTDCIKELKVEKIVSGSVVSAKDVVITTYTGVKIRILDADEKGLEKIDEGFIEYDNASTDYVKTFDYILVSLSKEPETFNKIVVKWSPIDNYPTNKV